jgi:hypothetical protein
MNVVGNKLLIEVDLAQDAGPSKSGRQRRREDIKIGLNVYRYADKKCIAPPRNVEVGSGRV